MAKALDMERLDIGVMAKMLGVSERIISGWIHKRGMPTNPRSSGPVTLKWASAFQWFMRMRRDELISDRKRRITPSGVYCPHCGRL